MVPSGDVELASVADTLSGPVVVTDKTALGFAGDTVTVCVVDAVAPTLSVIVAVTVNVPGDLYVC